MHKEVRLTNVLLYQSAGFLAVIAVCWVDELVGLTQLILGNVPYISNFRESTLKMLLILSVWLLVAGATRRVLAHVRYLESFMKICAWCRRIEYKGRWMRLEEFLEHSFETPTSHGICARCLEQRKAVFQSEPQSHCAPQGEQGVKLESPSSPSSVAPYSVPGPSGSERARPGLVRADGKLPRVDKAH